MNDKQRSDNACTPRRLKLATYNVRTLCKDGKLDGGKLFQLENGCYEHNIELVALQEHRYKAEDGLELINLESGVLILSAANDISVGGVGIYLRGRFRHLLLAYERISERILIAYLDTNPQLVLLAIYAPTDAATTEEKDAFYDDLSNATESIEAHNITILAGDFNAVGKHLL
jgi:hypothetical protein